MNASSEKLGFLRNIPKVRFEEEDRGYNKSQVDRVLESIAPIADAIEELQNRLAEAQARVASAEFKLAERVEDSDSSGALSGDGTSERSPDPEYDETLRKTLLLAQRTADSTIAEAESEAEAIRLTSQEESDGVLEAARSEATALSEAAQEEHTEMLSTTSAERDRLMTEAHDSAEEKRDELQAALDDSEGRARDELVRQTEDLTTWRDKLTEDVTMFESHLAERKQTIELALEQISGLVEGEFEPVNSPVANDVSGLETLETGAVLMDEVEVYESELDGDDEVGAPDSSGFTFGEGPLMTAGEETAMMEPISDGIGDDDEPSAFVQFVSRDDDPEPTSDSVGARPAWADAVPATDEVEPEDGVEIVVGGDPFLDELRRATGDGEASEADAEEEALARFMDEPDDGGRTGWFGRRK